MVAKQLFISTILVLLSCNVAGMEKPTQQHPASAILQTDPTPSSTSSSVPSSEKKPAAKKSTVTLSMLELRKQITALTNQAKPSYCD